MNVSSMRGMLDRLRIIVAYVHASALDVRTIHALALGRFDLTNATDETFVLHAARSIRPAAVADAGSAEVVRASARGGLERGRRRHVFHAD
jgi:hypothetical protein